ncbi:Basic blue protein [Spatholobus suberectus]|nr:Basic blue protein [Spatholobus suberectus]
MAQGSSTTIFLLLLFPMLVLYSEMVRADTYTVGNAGRWTFDVVDWPNGKSFKAGDTLVFNYCPRFHNVVAVDEAGYKTCSSAKGVKVYQSGKDEIQLAPGQNYFISGFPDNCQMGMKIAVNAA